jgi:starvation-inducible DNA-binding protein
MTEGMDVQGFGSLRYLLNASAQRPAGDPCHLLNRILADTIVLYDLYRTCHSRIRGTALGRLRLRLDDHALEQLELIDLLVEGVEKRGGVAISDPRRVAELTSVRLDPDWDENLAAMLFWVSHVHNIIVREIADIMDRIPTAHRLAHDAILPQAALLHHRQLQVLANLKEIAGRPNRLLVEARLEDRTIGAVA